MAITPLQDYEKSCERLRFAFIRSLYSDQNDRARINAEGHWIGDSIGEVYCWWDWFVDAKNMADYFRYEFTPDEFFDWYDQWTENSSTTNRKNQKIALSMKAFKKLL